MYQYQRITPYWASWMPPIEPITPAPIGFPQQIINDNDTINVGSGNQIINGNPSPVTVTNVTTTTYTALPTDYFLCVEIRTEAVIITLPTGILGTVYVIKDCTGNASPTLPIIVQGTGQNVDIGTATIDTSFGSISVIFNGVDWSIV